MYYSENPCMTHDHQDDKYTLESTYEYLLAPMFEEVTRDTEYLYETIFRNPEVEKTFSQLLHQMVVSPSEVPTSEIKQMQQALILLIEKEVDFRARQRAGELVSRHAEIRYARQLALREYVGGRL